MAADEPLPDVLRSGRPAGLSDEDGLYCGLLETPEQLTALGAFAGALHPFEDYEKPHGDRLLSKRCALSPVDYDAAFGFAAGA